MNPARIPPYLPPWWLPGPHLQTIAPARLLPAPRPRWRRERWELDDGDFLDVDHAQPEPEDAGAPVLVMLHGLEGGSGSHYARSLATAALRRGWRAQLVHFRGCGGEDNRLPRAYHSGDSDEIDAILARVAADRPQARRMAVGISLGGNALAKWAGEQGRAASGRISACAVVSSPVDLLAGGLALERGFNRVYTRMFLATLRGKALAKVARFPGLADAGRIARARTLREFDDAFTAPVHGFHGVYDYWTRSSALPRLRGVAIPMLLLNARNDPFLPQEALPGPAQVSAAVTLEQPREGGHVGFYRGGASPWYLAERVCEFLDGAR